MKKSKSFLKRTNKPKGGYLIIGWIVLAAAIALIVFSPQDSVWHQIVALATGLILSALFFRFPPRWIWMNLLILIMFYLVLFLLGVPGIPWLAGVIAGSNFGVHWRYSDDLRKRADRKGEWLVDGQGYEAKTDGWVAAKDHLYSFDRRQGDRLMIEHKSARFEIAGTPNVGFICHRTVDISDDQAWTVLTREVGSTPDEYVDVPMKVAVGNLPERLVHSLGTVEETMKEFFDNPLEDSFREQWESGDQAMDTRLS